MCHIYKEWNSEAYILSKEGIQQVLGKWNIGEIEEGRIWGSDQQPFNTLSSYALSESLWLCFFLSGLLDIGIPCFIYIFYNFCILLILLFFWLRIHMLQTLLFFWTLKLWIVFSMLFFCDFAHFLVLYMLMVNVFIDYSATPRLSFFNHTKEKMLRASTNVTFYLLNKKFNFFAKNKTKLKIIKKLKININVHM